MQVEPLLSVIIVTWNSAKWLPACLASVERALAGLKAEVWLVDNGSADASVERARHDLPGINVIANDDNLGFARASNQGIEHSRGGYLLLLNPDAEINHEALAGMMAVLDSQPDVGLVGCRIVGRDGKAQECYGTTYPGIRHRSPAVRPWAGHPEFVDAAWLGGACMLARRQAVQQVGALDPDYLMYYEDVDWGLRMRRGGWRVLYWDGGQVMHHGGGASAQVPSAETARRYMTSEMVFHAKHSGGLVLAGVWAARLLRALRGAGQYGLMCALGWRDPEHKYERYRAWLDVLVHRSWRAAKSAAEQGNS